jgi:hypothetical protein
MIVRYAVKTPHVDVKFNLRYFAL